MAISQTPRLGLTLWSSDSDERSRTQHLANHQNLESRAGLFSKGSFPARPEASASTARMFWWSTDTELLSVSDGSSWSNVLAYGAPTALAGNSTAANGTLDFAARSDHVHAMPGFGTPVDITTSNTFGNATTLARSDHVHRIGTGAINSSALFVAGVVDSDALGAGSVTSGKVATGSVNDVGIFADGVIGANHLSLIPVVTAGAVMAWAGSTAPAGWLLCDGSEVSRETYATLFAVIGTTYGAGNGSTTFNLPDMRGRVLVGRNAADSDFNTLGKSGGTKTVQLTSVSQIPAHSHTINHTHSTGSLAAAGGHSHSVYIRESLSPLTIYNVGVGSDVDIGVPVYGLLVSGIHTNRVAVTWPTSDYSRAKSSGGHAHSVTIPGHNGSSSSVGSGTAHNNVQPYLTTNFIIKA